MSWFGKFAAMAAVGVALLAAPAARSAVVMVNVNYDLGASTLAVNYDSVNGLDWYTSLPLALGNVAVAAGDF